MHIESQRVTEIRALVPATGHAKAISEVAMLVAHHADVPISEVFGASRARRPIARARQLAMYLAHVMLGESLTSVGAVFGRDRTTVSYACGLIEDMRDDPSFDAEVEGLERRLQGRGN